jgi:DNA-binding NtrC family response regulator
VIEITVPPLRERPDDIITLAKFIINRHCSKIGRPIPSLSDKLVAALEKYSWPGNVRELENLCERSLLLSTSDQLDENHFPPHIFATTQTKKQSLGTITDHHKSLIQRAIDLNKGNITRAAEELGVARSTLYRNMRKYNIHV